MTKIHRKPNHTEVYGNYEFLEKNLPAGVHIGGLPLIGNFQIYSGREEVADIATDLELIILTWPIKEVPDWIDVISKKIEKKTSNEVHVYLSR
jgi:hypothetical protein